MLRMGSARTAMAAPAAMAAENDDDYKAEAAIRVCASEHAIWRPRRSNFSVRKLLDIKRRLYPVTAMTMGTLRGGGRIALVL